ncbi:MAG: class I SAM-dependent methyltransferase, partial [bacterium]
MAELPEIQLTPGREKKIRAFYPWVQRGETRSAPELPDGTVARLIDSEGNFVGVGTYNAKSRFVFRVFSLRNEQLDEAFFVNRFQEAKELRTSLNLGSNAIRTVFSEADRVPGLIVDEYDGHAVAQVRSKGIDLLRDFWLPAYLSVFGPSSVLERSDMAGRQEEGMGSVVQPLFGSPPDDLWIHEDDLRMKVLIKEGLKTGYYADQRNSRRLLRSLVKPGEKVLDCFCYTGGFALHAAKAGAKVFGVDIHPVAIETARENAT